MEQEKELKILRGVIKLVLLEKGVKLLPQNEFNRQMSSISKALGVEVEDLKGVVLPIIEEIFSEMISGKKVGDRRFVIGSGVPGPAFNHPDAGKVGD